jgi:hypothetical protein
LAVVDDAGTKQALDHPRHSVVIGLAVIGCAITIALAVAACGSAGPSTSTGTGSGDALALKFATCMRAHGVPNFPDPGVPVGQPGSGIDPDAPAVQASEQTCDKLTNNPQPKGSPASAAQRHAALDQAACMRKHGVPNFPDPTFLSSGGDSVNLAGLNPQSPAFRKARRICGP